MVRYTGSMRWSRSPWVLLLPLAAALAAPIGVARTIQAYGVNVPVQDQWRFAHEVVAYVNGRYDLATLWAPFGPHRIVFPKAVMLTLAGWTDWDTRAEMWFDFVVVIACVGLLADLARQTLRHRAPHAWPWLVPLMSTSLFTLGAWHGWTLGWMMNLYLAVFGGIVSAWGLGRFGATAAGGGVCVVGGVIAAYSYLGAMPLLVLAPLALALHPTEGRGRAAGAGTIVAAALAIALYLVDYPTGATAGSLSGDGLSLGSIVAWVLKYLGSRFAVWNGDVATVWGIVAVAIAAFALGGFVRSREDRAALLPWLLLLAYVAAGGVLTAAGRQMGPHAPLLSRFAMFPALFWAAVPCALILGVHAWGWSAWPAPARRAGAVVALIALVVAGQGYVGNWSLGRAKTQQRHRALVTAVGCLEQGARADLRCLQLLSRANPQLVRRMSARVARLRLGPFAGVP